MLARPRIAIAALVAVQQGFTWSRDLWWADEVRQAAVLRHLLDSGDWIMMSVWINIVVLGVMPSLDAVYSPQPIVAAMRANSREGSGFAACGLVPGVLAYDLGEPYFELPSIAALRTWAATSRRPVFVMLERQWCEAFAGGREYAAIGRLILGGEAVVVAQRAQSD